VFRTAAESLAVENVARPGLKQQAERAIDDRSTDLRAAHQSETTNDLLDVIAGSEASSGCGDCLRRN
jgi:F0F1-type ATP synthase gamma subunit